MTRKKFTFVSKALPEDTLKVVSFKGVEGMSRPYEFDITLVSEDPDIDLKEVIKNPATFNINFEGEDFPTHGRLAQFEQVHEIPGHIYYRAVLVPRLWEAGLYNGNQLFLDKSVPEIITEVLKQVGLTGKDYDLKLARTYPKWEYICQYQETHLNFLSWWMEREGIYYFFEQTEQSEKLIITDSVTGHQDIKGEKMVNYSPPSGLDHPEEEVIVAFLCQQRMLPNKVILKDYNYRKPSLEIKAEAIVDSNGRGDVYLYGEHFKDPGQGTDLAKIRAEELLCREKVFWGEGTVPSLSPGFIFELAGHYRDSNNQRYLITEVEHNGRQTGAFLSGLEKKPAEGKEELGYSNRFACIPATLQFRPERKAPKPRFYGVMNAVVDAAGDGKYAELDDQGRYKVILPFDLSGNSGGKASRWIRMAQPYSGPNYGMHFPLHKGAEVLLTFVDGDPDRPIISGAVPNPETKSPVTSANQTKSVIRDNYGNEIVLDSTPGDEHILLHSPHHKSVLELGKSANSFTDSDCAKVSLGNSAEAVVGTKVSAFGGATLEAKGGIFTELNAGLKYCGNLTGSQAINIGYDWALYVGPKTEITTTDKNSIAKENIIISSGKTLCLIGGAGKVIKEDNTSIINANEDSITLTVGEKQEPFEPGADPFAAIFMVSAALFAAVASVAAALASEASSSLEKYQKEDQGFAWFLGGPTIAAATLAFAAAIIYAVRIATRKNTPQIVTHDNPVAKIEMNKKGDINIHSNSNSQYDRKINLQVGPPNADPEAEIRMTHDGIRIDAGKGKAEIHIKKDGNVSIWSHKDLNIKALGDIKMESMNGGKVKLSGNKFSADPNMTFDWRNLVVV